MTFSGDGQFSSSGHQPSANATVGKLNLPPDSDCFDSVVSPLLIKGGSPVEPLEAPCIHHLNAAEGWLELGDCPSALEELELIDPAMRFHPDVLAVRCDIHTATMTWPEVVCLAWMLVKLIPDRPYAWIRRSFALHGLKQTQQAFDLLLPAAEKFPEIPTIPYNLACYSAQLGRLEEARRWLGQSYKIGNARMLKSAARFDPDLAPLFAEASAM